MNHNKNPRLLIIKKLWAEEPDLTQRMAAEEMGISQSAISQYMTGSIPLNLDIIIKFARLFKVSPPKIDNDLEF